MKQPKEIFVDTSRCTGCQTCVIACSVVHSKSKNLFAALSEKPAVRSRIFVEWVETGEKVPILCRHCEDAPCMHACICGAISRDEEGVVITDADRCIGCWTCVMVCPYGVIGRHPEEKKAYRCDRCPDLDTPACVTNCPTKALIYESVDKYSTDIRETAAREFTSGKKD